MAAEDPGLNPKNKAGLRQVRRHITVPVVLTQEEIPEDGGKNLEYVFWVFQENLGIINAQPEIFSIKILSRIVLFLKYPKHILQILFP